MTDYKTFDFHINDHEKKIDENHTRFERYWECCAVLGVVFITVFYIINTSALVIASEDKHTDCLYNNTIPLVIWINIVAPINIIYISLSIRLLKRSRQKKRIKKGK